MSAISPQAEKELGEIGNLLSGIVVDAGAVSGSTINFESANEDSAKILYEAQTIAESRMKDTFPELPGSTGGLENRV
jgi:division protein CdvB (Snf7/Vps24/ESCRT-III family)